MLLDVSTGFLRSGTAVPFQTEVELPTQDVIGEQVSFDKVSLQGTYTVLEGVIRLQGELKTMVHAQCAMCLSQVDVPLAINFSEEFRKDANELEEDAFHYEGKGVPLSQMSLTLVMLNLPMRFLCNEECKGSLELQAWQADRIKSSCEDGAPSQRPFEALQHLLKMDEEV